MLKKLIVKRLQKTCACCGKAIRVIIYSKKDYRGGHFFGKIPLCTKKEIARANKKDPKPYGYTEYWECSGCYWGKKKS